MTNCTSQPKLHDLTQLTPLRSSNNTVPCPKPPLSKTKVIIIVVVTCEPYPDHTPLSPIQSVSSSHSRRPPHRRRTLPLQSLSQETHSKIPTSGRTSSRCYGPGQRHGSRGSWRNGICWSAAANDSIHAAVIYIRSFPCPFGLHSPTGTSATSATATATRRCHALWVQCRPNMTE